MIKDDVRYCDLCSSRMVGKTGTDICLICHLLLEGASGYCQVNCRYATMGE
jgi:hypothetical protein